MASNPSGPYHRTVADDSAPMFRPATAHGRARKTTLAVIAAGALVTAALLDGVESGDPPEIPAQSTPALPASWFVPAEPESAPASPARRRAELEASVADAEHARARARAALARAREEGEHGPWLDALEARVEPDTQPVATPSPRAPAQPRDL